MQKIKSGISALLILLAIATPLIVYALPTSYSVKNTTNEALGNVTLHQASNSTTINISSPGTWVTSVDGPVSAVTVNGYTVYYPNQAYIILPSSGHTARVDWQTSSLIEIIDVQVIS